MSGGDVVADVALLVLDVLDDERAFAAGVGGKLAKRRLRPRDATMLGAGGFVTFELEVAECAPGRG